MSEVLKADNELYVNCAGCGRRIAINKDMFIRLISECRSISPLFCSGEMSEPQTTLQFLLGRLQYSGAMYNRLQDIITCMQEQLDITFQRLGITAENTKKEIMNGTTKQASV